LDAKSPPLRPSLAMKSIAKAISGVAIASQCAAATPVFAGFLQGGSKCSGSKAECAKAVAEMIVENSRACFKDNTDAKSYNQCVDTFCGKQCDKGTACEKVCTSKGHALLDRLDGEIDTAKAKRAKERAELEKEAQDAADESTAALGDLQAAQNRIRDLSASLKKKAEAALKKGGKEADKAKAQLAKVEEMSKLSKEIDEHLDKVQSFKGMAKSGGASAKAPAPSFLQVRSTRRSPPEEQLAKEMTHDLEMNFNKIAPFGKEDTAKELQDHASKTQDTLVDAVENAEVAEIKRAVFRALTRLRAATIKEFDTIARLETQAIDAYNDAHHYRAENPLAHLHEDEAPVETDKLKSFH
jgi:hypothetical protein